MVADPHHSTEGILRSAPHSAGGVLHRGQLALLPMLRRCVRAVPALQEGGGEIERGAHSGAAGHPAKEEPDKCQVNGQTVLPAEYDGGRRR